MELKKSDVKKYISDSYGIDLREDKLNKLLSIINKDIDLDKFARKEEVFSYINSHHKVEEKIISEIVVHETHFFRNVHQFLQLRDYMLPYLIRKKSKIKILSLGCATGEEPYSIAMIVDYYFKGFKKAITIEAVDLAGKAIDKAVTGVYKKYSFKNYDEFKELKKYYFKSLGDKYVIADEIKSMVKFRKANVFTFLKYNKEVYDLIFCRNLIIYFDEETMRRFLDLVTKNLDKNGFYVAGHSEILEKIHNGFQIIFLGETFIYKKRAVYKPVQEDHIDKKEYISNNKLPINNYKRSFPSKNIIKTESKVNLLVKREAIYKSIEEENYENVEKLCDEYLRDRDDAEIRFIMSYALMNLKEFEKSIEILKAAKGMNSLIKYHIILGINYYFLLRLSNAVRSFKSVLFICDSSIYAHYYLGIIYEQMQNYNMAKKFFDKAVINSKRDKCDYDMSIVDKNIAVELQEFVKIAKEKSDKIRDLIKE